MSAASMRADSADSVHFVAVGETKMGQLMDDRFTCQLVANTSES